ncbi:hypothetical protein HYQ46_012666 [Verticillium longisporum]|nr:hypothetical protein HYQ46_012666 [Verticillium longisporum]
MSNLETLDISVPVSLLHGIGQLFNGPFDLACLKSASLFYQCPEDGYWDLRENIHIFAHPTLDPTPRPSRSCTLSSATSTMTPCPTFLSSPRPCKSLS